MFQGNDVTWSESVLITGGLSPVLYINVYLFYFIFYCKMLAPSGMKSQRDLSVLKWCHQDSLSILLKIIRCLGALLMKAYFNDLCCLFLRVKKNPSPTEEEGG